MVTHDNTLAGFADRIIRIVDGKIVDMIDNREEKKDEKQDEKHDVEV
jgi:putative ABC transport system ATP-binding protein